MAVSVKQKLLTHSIRQELEDRSAGRGESGEDGGCVGAVDAGGHDVVEFFDEQTHFRDEFNEALGDENAGGDVRCI